MSYTSFEQWKSSVNQTMASCYGEVLDDDKEKEDYLVCLYNQGYDAEQAAEELIHSDV